MNVEFINPFLSSLMNVLSTIAQTQLKPGKPMMNQPVMVLTGSVLKTLI